MKEYSVPENTHFCPSKQVIFQKLEENLILIHTQTNHIFDLNETGAKLWELLSNGYSIAQARSTLLSEFEVGETQLNEEIAQTVGLFVKEKLLEIK
jgi:Coenzyme PQQ synthesis protein D (PqqD)